MEINFESTSVKAYQEILRQTKRIQVNMESVVPDVNDDIGHILSVRSQILLKSKDLTAHGVIVTGEVSAVVLYVNELANAVCDLSLSRSFSLEYELEGEESELQTRIRLFAGSSEARMINPRKVSVAVEVGGELSAFSQTEIRVASSAPTEQRAPIHIQTEQTSGSLVSAVCEKTFVLNEQFSLPAGMPEPERLIWQSAAFCLSDQQQIGSKILVKGEVQLSLLYKAKDEECPTAAEFSAPFSQLVDIGQEETEHCFAGLETTSLYFSLLDTIGGEKSIDAEVHALLQLTGCCRQEYTVISDAYSNLFPSALSFEQLPVVTGLETRNLRLEREDRIDMPEDCIEVLTVFDTVGVPTLGDETLDTPVSLDILYRCGDGTLACVRRSFPLSAKRPEGELLLHALHMAEKNWRLSDGALSVRLCLELPCELRVETRLENAVSMSLLEDSPFEWKACPSLTVVRADQESIWELAKRYHSSAESIETLNETEGALDGKLLLIPRTL